jgi:hypothetical protein
MQSEQQLSKKIARFRQKKQIGRDLLGFGNPV